MENNRVGLLSKIKRAMRRERWNAERYYQIFLYVFIFLLSLVCLYPLVYVLSASLMSVSEWQARGGVFLVPHRPTLEAYKFVLSQHQLYQSLGVSVARTVVGAVLSVVTCALTGYALSRNDFFGKKPLSVLLFITLIYYGGLIPSYLVIEQMGLLNTFWVFVIPSMLGGWNALVFRQTFQGVPPEIEESAMVDGASPLEFLVRRVDVYRFVQRVAHASATLFAARVCGTKARFGAGDPLKRGNTENGGRRDRYRSYPLRIPFLSEILYKGRVRRSGQGIKNKRRR